MTLQMIAVEIKGTWDIVAWQTAGGIFKVLVITSTKFSNLLRRTNSISCRSANRFSFFFFDEEPEWLKEKLEFSKDEASKKEEKGHLAKIGLNYIMSKFCRNHLINIAFIYWWNIDLPSIKHNMFIYNILKYIWLFAYFFGSFSIIPWL